MSRLLDPAPPAHGAAKKVAAPVIQNFTVDPANQLTPGPEIGFVVEGTRKGKANVRIAGVPRTINLAEVDDAVYEGSYTVRSTLTGRS